MTVPRYVLSVPIQGVSGKCIFAICEGLPSKSVLLGKDLGPTFHKFITMAVAKPWPVKLTRAQSEALLAEEADECSAQQLADEGTPHNLDSISDSLLSTSG